MTSKNLGFNNVIKVLFLLHLSQVISYCHNDCNGHGTCGENDKCTCYKNRNGDSAWMGTSNDLNIIILYR